MTWRLFVFLACCSAAWAEGEKKPENLAPQIHYREGKEIDFEQLLIQGQLKRPELMVVTGNTDQGTDGLLRLRENFVDQLTIAAGEELEGSK